MKHCIPCTHFAALHESGLGTKRKCAGPSVIMPGIGGSADTDLRR
jgi:hypothetical protein